MKMSMNTMEATTLTSSRSLGVIFSSHSATLLESSEICAYFAACAKKFSWETKRDKSNLLIPVI